MAVAASERLVHAASLADVRAAGRLVVHVDRHTLCLFAEGDGVYAVDNRCPHMGFPLHRGSVADGEEDERVAADVRDESPGLPQLRKRRRPDQTFGSNRGHF